ncbi:hypothetical protein HUS70_01875 [Pandoraea nosoerga]|uniref:Uncharacterized protein n=1 Tax=Pandoraea nosoerga TaxID=2508296 RepID=A0A5E4S1Q5_9BURK|nr:MULTISPECIES: hypothetical protein [Pandoraea]MBN4667682.1 hypothetical protein [Pandoraea nosoerga]MBN4676634.1 hypothetical protein [Pandoraea nosoerga]MBN4683082.1 hypothetical protein [Pandoraea nosoerga]MBN4743435.1 hypothetical protein [Pandoraea nosoerga]VVD69073.1 hypothetical protein PNO31109_00502 [Pandoraea nosoerga]
MDFEWDWLTIGVHRLRLRAERGFPTEGMRKMANVIALAIENNMSARARIVEIVFSRDGSLRVDAGTTVDADVNVVPQICVALATVFALPPEAIQMNVTVVTQSEVDLHFGVYERMLAEKVGAVPPLH